MENKNNIKKIIFVLMVIVMLYGIKIINSNEYSYAKANEPVSNIKYYTIDSNNIDKKYNDKLIVTRGKISIGNTQVTDDKFGISVKSAKLVRVVETYTCREICDQYSTKKECETVKEWTQNKKTTVIKDDPACIKPLNNNDYNDLTFNNINTKLGSFKLSLEYIDALPAEQQVLNLNEETAQKLNLYIKDSSYTTTPPNEEPKAGDVRISFYYVKPQAFTVLGKQNNDTIESYRRETGFIISYLTDKDLTGTQMLKTMNDTPYEPPGLWSSRYLGIILTVIGSIFSTILGCSIFKKNNMEVSKLKLIIASLSIAIMIDMFVIISIWYIKDFSPEEEIIAIIMLIFSTITFIVSLIAKDPILQQRQVVNNLLQQQNRHSYDNFKEKYGSFTANHSIFNETPLEQETYERRNSYENPYKIKSSSSKSYQRNPNNEESYKNPYK